MSSRRPRRTPIQRPFSGGRAHGACPDGTVSTERNPPTTPERPRGALTVGSGIREDDHCYVAGDFSGIQDYVLGVKASGKAQAKRLRARSFHVELFEQAALARARDRLQAVEDGDVLVRGGGGFLLRAAADVPVQGLEDLHRDLQRRVFEESGGELRFSMGWGHSVAQARGNLERGKRRPWKWLLCNGNGWSSAALHRPAISPPCEVCGRSRAEVGPSGYRAECPSCRAAARVGERLTRWNLLRPATRAETHTARALGVFFGQADESGPGAFRVRREIPRRDPSGEPWTFEELAAEATGTRRLAVLKADVDDMGLRVSRIADGDPTYRSLRRFSADLHKFFSDSVGDLARSWGQVYTLFAGGDDLLLIGPWDVIVDFAGAVRKEFAEGPGQAYPGLTLSAGIALSPYRLPVRHAVRQAEELLERAKDPTRGKDRCAALGVDWRWGRHEDIVANGRLLARSARERAASRSLLRGLLNLLDGASDPRLRAARWSYRFGRADPGLTGAARAWANRVLDDISRNHENRIAESAASLRYALLATRQSRKDRRP